MSEREYALLACLVQMANWTGNYKVRASVLAFAKTYLPSEDKETPLEWPAIDLGELR